MVNNWNTKTPKNFKFTAKFPKVITHERRLKDVYELMYTNSDMDLINVFAIKEDGCIVIKHHGNTISSV